MTDSPEEAVLDVVAEDVEDLKAEVRRLSAALTALQDAPPAGPGTDRDEDVPTDDAPAEDGPALPPFILRLDEPDLSRELRALAEWVEGLLVPVYLRTPSVESRWCAQWIEHPDAVAHLHALWLAWQELTDPSSGGYTGPSTWHHHHLRPCMTELRAAQGPFEGCTKSPHEVKHRIGPAVPSTWYRD